MEDSEAWSDMALFLLLFVARGRGTVLPDREGFGLSSVTAIAAIVSG